MKTMTMVAAAILIALSLGGGAAFAQSDTEARDAQRQAEKDQQRERRDQERAKRDQQRAHEEMKEELKAKAKAKAKAAKHGDDEVDVPDAPDAPDAPEMQDVDCDGDKKSAHDDSDDCDDDTAASKGPKTVQVKGPVHFRLEAISSDVRLQTSQRKDVTVSAGSCSVELDDSGGDIEAQVDGDCSDPIDVQLPSGSSPEIETVDGGVTLRGEYGRVRAQTVNGDLRLDKAADVELDVVSGAVNIGTVAGQARINTVSGDVKLRMTNPSPQLKYDSVSGALDWGGTCGKGCKLKIHAFSGDVDLHLDASSGFEVKLISHSGDLDDQLGVKPVKSGGRGAVTVKGTYGSANGQIKVETYSGGLKLHKK